MQRDVERAVEIAQLAAQLFNGLLLRPARVGLPRALQQARRGDEELAPLFAA